MDLRLKRAPGIYLTGFMASGKSTVARHLADRIGWEFVDLDAEIEAGAGDSVARIFAACGESEFRRIETDTFHQWRRRVEAGWPAVIALGGGSFTQPAIFETLADHGLSIWLDCSFSTINARLNDAERAARPLTRDQVAFRRLYEERRAFYERAHFPHRCRLRTGSGGGANSRAAVLEMSRNLREDARAFLDAAIAAADPTSAIEKHLRARKDLDRYERIFVVGAGKAGGGMAVAVERILDERIAEGCVIVKDGDRARTARIELQPAGHPVPDERGLRASKRIVDICDAAGEKDLVLCLISGGASSLMSYPDPPLTLEDIQQTTQLLLDSGATIQEMNAVRKHMSAITGGRLARIAAPADVVSLILSDVVGDRLDAIGSGPTAPDVTTFKTATAVLEKYHILDCVSPRLRDHLRRAAHETPKPGDPLFNNVENIIVGSNQKSLEAAAAAAKDAGYHTLILSSTIEGETRDVAAMHAAIARQIRTHGQPLQPPACIVSGGETTVTIRGHGTGGRNQEFALAAAIGIAGLKDTLILSAGTDGTDGPTGAAGAVADGTTVARSKKNAGEALASNDSGPFFEDLDDLVITGPTGTNVMDLHLILVA